MTREPSTQPITTKLPLFSACKSDILQHVLIIRPRWRVSNHILTSLKMAIIFCDEIARTTASRNEVDLLLLQPIDRTRTRTDTRRLSHYLLRDHSSSKVYPCISFRSPYMDFHCDLAKAFPWLLYRCVQTTIEVEICSLAGSKYLRGTAMCSNTLLVLA